VARDGQQALDFLFKTDAHAWRGGPGLPAVVLLDISLPRLSGLEVLERLRADPAPPVCPWSCSLRPTSCRLGAVSAETGVRAPRGVIALTCLTLLPGRCAMALRPR
jgi:CheY-like chemotaxis protein